MSIGTALIIAAVLLIANAFFVGAEFAIMSVRRAQLEPLVADGVRGAKTAMYAVEHVSLMLAAAQLGITICSTGLGAVAEPALARLVEAPLLAAGFPAQASHIVGFTLALAIVIYLHVVLGEMVPKNLAVSDPERAALWFGPPLVWVARAIRPVISGLNWFANHILSWFGVETKDEVSSTFTAEEVSAIIARSQADGIHEDELALISGAIEFSDACAAVVMVPLDAVVSLSAGVTVAELEAAVARTGFSRFPITDGPGATREGEISGYLHVKDTLYAQTGAERESAIPSWRIRAYAITGVEEDIEDVLATMQATGTHLALMDQVLARLMELQPAPPHQTGSERPDVPGY